MTSRPLPHDHGDHKHISKASEILDNIENFQIISDVFKNLGDPTRVRIFWFLCHYTECVTNIAAIVNMSSPAISHHLRCLKNSGLIESFRDGKEVYYHAADSVQSQLLHQMIEQVMEIACPDMEPLPDHFDHSICNQCGKTSECKSSEDAISPIPDFYRENINAPISDCCQKKEITLLPENSFKDRLISNHDNYKAEQLEVIHQIHELLTVHMDKRWTVGELSRKYLMNPTTLKQLFRSEYGNSIAAHIREHRMEKAALLLKTTSLSLGEIAREIGYSSQSKFTAAFKSYYHMLPRDYRSNFLHERN